MQPEHYYGYEGFYSDEEERQGLLREWKRRSAEGKQQINYFLKELKNLVKHLNYNHEVGEGWDRAKLSKETKFILQQMNNTVHGDEIGRIGFFALPGIGDSELFVIYKRLSDKAWVYWPDEDEFQVYLHQRNPGEYNTFNGTSWYNY